MRQNQGIHRSRYFFRIVIAYDLFDGIEMLTVATKRATNHGIGITTIDHQSANQSGVTNHAAARHFFGNAFAFH